MRHRLLGMYDSSLFPLPAGAAAAETASTVRRLLPPFVTAADYLGAWAGDSIDGDQYRDM